MAITPEQFNKLATKDDLKELVKINDSILDIKDLEFRFKIISKKLDHIYNLIKC